MLEYGIYLIVFCLPMYLVRFKIFGLPTNVLEVMIGILFIVWAIQGGFGGIKKDLKGFKGAIIPIILILIGVTITTIFSWDLRTSAGIWKGWFVVPLIFFLILITTIKKPEQIKKIFYSLILSGFIVSIISLIYLIQGNLNNQGRLQGFYNSPNYLAMYLAPILIIGGILFGAKIICSKTRVGAPAWRRAPSRPRFDRALGLRRVFFTNNLRPTTFLIVSRFLFLVNCFLLIVVLFFTKSLGAWLGIIIAFCFGLAMVFYKQKKKRLFFLIIVLGLLIVLLFGLIKTSVLSGGQSSFNARLMFWQKSWQAFKQYPVIGIGPGTFQDYFPLYPKWGVPQPHNLYLAFLLQTGIIGFIGFIWLLIYFFKRGLLINNQLSIIIIMLMIYILTHGLVDTTYWKNDLSIMFWLFVGLMVIIPVLKNKAVH